MKTSLWIGIAAILAGCGAQGGGSDPAPPPAPAPVASAAPATVAQPAAPASRSVAGADKDEGVGRGDKAPDFSGEVVYGGKGQLQLSQFVGEAPTTQKDGVVVAFGASWCGRCKESLPTLKSLAAEHKTLQILYVGTDETEEGWTKEIAHFQGLEMGIPLLKVADVQGLLQQYFGDARNIPRFYLVDYQGMILLKDTGFSQAKMGKLLPKQVNHLLQIPQQRKG